MVLGEKKKTKKLGIGETTVRVYREKNCLLLLKVFLALEF